MTEKQDFFTLLNGRVTFKRGLYHPTSDAVWLAAFAADFPGKTVLDIGIGTGGVSLCLLANRPEVSVTGIDNSVDMLLDCKINAHLNDRQIDLISASITSWSTPQVFDIVVTNPPYFKGTPANHNAHHNVDLVAWMRKSIARVKPQGYFCTIIDALALAEVVQEVAKACGDVNIIPLFGAQNVAERVLISAKKCSKSGSTLHCGLSMNTDLILRNGLTIKTALSKLYMR